jgi:holo-[acyl-carrier protein] synthase
MIVGIGVDIVEIPRLRRTLERFGDRFTERVFTSEELQYCEARVDPVPHYAARFAAKEALFKALGTGWAKGITWQSVSVRRIAANAPHLALTGEAEKLSNALGAKSVHLSLSHSDNSAIALVILEG